MDIKRISLLCTLTLAMTSAYADNPASQEWVLQQIAANPQRLSAADWNALCTTGSATSATGCYGNVASPAFTKVNNAVGGFTRYANINPVNAPSSVFVKSFFGGTNLPASNGYLSVDVISGAARCVLFTELGYGAGPSGINNTVESPGNSSGPYTAPQTIGTMAINGSTGLMDYESNFTAPNLLFNQPPLYLLCVGFNTTDATTASAITVSAT